MNDNEEIKKAKQKARRALARGVVVRFSHIVDSSFTFSFFLVGWLVCWLLAGGRSAASVVLAAPAACSLSSFFRLGCSLPPLSPTADAQKRRHAQPPRPLPAPAKPEGRERRRKRKKRGRGLGPNSPIQQKKVYPHSRNGRCVPLLCSLCDTPPQLYATSALPTFPPPPPPPPQQQYPAERDSEPGGAKGGRKRASRRTPCSPLFSSWLLLLLLLLPPPPLRRPSFTVSPCYSLYF